MKQSSSSSPYRKRSLIFKVLLGVALIGSILVIMILINPNQQLGDARNTRRSEDINTILTAVYQYILDNNGEMPAKIYPIETEICATGTKCEKFVDLSVLTDQNIYLEQIPKDPKKTSPNGTGYDISKGDNGRVTVAAPHAEHGATISLTR